MVQSVALVTPSHRGDLERFVLLCDSVDRFVTGYDRHYVIVNDDDMALFARFDGDHRVVLPSSDFLPFWIRPLPRFLSRNGRRTWWSFRSAPLHGWHIQQLLKIKSILSLPYRRYCIVDSDNVFFRPFNVATYAGNDSIPLYVDRHAVRNPHAEPGRDAPAQGRERDARDRRIATDVEYAERTGFAYSSDKPGVRALERTDPEDAHALERTLRDPTLCV